MSPVSTKAVEAKPDGLLLHERIWYSLRHVGMRPTPVGLARFAPVEPARGPMFSARTRARAAGQSSGQPAVAEREFYA